ncbi:MAG: CoA transferase [Sphingomonadaceae bacterium]|nr:CoA transferase [Sphingomonadaceae bacterium]
MTAVWAALGGETSALDRLRLRGDGPLASVFPVNDLAATAIGAAALAVAELVGSTGGEAPIVAVDRRLAAMWFASSLRPIGWRPAGAWDALAGDYRTRDGWIRLHTNAPHHRAAALRVLGDHSDKDGLRHAISRETAGALEAAIVAAGGCAAEMRSVAAWASHPQGRAVGVEPLVRFELTDAAGSHRWQPRADRPLAGIKVLDLTRVLAGPVATRFLAGYGAEVLRIDAPDWDEPAVVPEITIGKRCARLDLHDAADRARFERLLSEADILVHGLRADALARLGYDDEARARIAPGLIDVALDAYGWSGPWAKRRGFDSLVQMSAGIADAGMQWARAEAPFPLPVQALDHATGYLMAAAAIRALEQRTTRGRACSARLSLARIAKLLTDHAGVADAGRALDETEADLAADLEETAWGPARRLRAPAEIAGAPMAWDCPASPLGSVEPGWR